MSLKKITRLFSSIFHKTNETKTCHGNFHSCPEESSHTGKNKISFLLYPLLPLIGLMSLIWFLIRVIPKPSRATYPCQRLAFPLASGFIIWIMGIIGSALAYRKARKLFLHSRKLAALICLIASISFIYLSLMSSNEKLQAADPVTPNQPIGEAKGIHPGRVAWIHDANATSWQGSDGDTSQPYWHTDTCTNPDVVAEMMSKSLRLLAGTNTDSDAWDAIFRNFNQQAGRGDIGYTPGEKIAIKVNFVLMLSGANGGSKGTSSYDQIDNAPQLTIALLRQLIDIAGVAPQNISIGDPQNLMPDHWYQMVYAKCPGVVYLCKNGGSQTGRTPVSPDNNAPFYFSDPCSPHWNGVTKQDYIPNYFAQADYFINFPILKSHNSAGITVAGKNHYGSLMRAPNASGYYNEHNTRPANTDSSPFSRSGMGYYRANVDLMGHPKLGGKTMLVLVDGLYAGRSWDSHPIKWNMTPFNGDWPSSIFLSQDQVAADSVAFDFMVNEWNAAAGTINGYPQYSGTQDYLHEAALVDNPPSGTLYDPNHDGGLKLSLGVHEHWNNAVDKQYSRNLGTGNGIELVTGFETSVTDGPVLNINSGKKYSTIQNAIDAASTNHHISVSPGIYNESIDFKGKSLKLSSSNPDNPAIVASTIIKGGNKAVIFGNGEDANSIITGFTITDANTAVYCAGASPTISKCRITENKNYGIELRSNASPLISCCEIVCNMGSGIAVTNGLFSKPLISQSIIAANRQYGVSCRIPQINNCTIAANGLQGITGQSPKISNSIIFFNSRDTDNVQIDGSSATVTYSNIQGGWTGTENINQDPCFAQTGYWDANDTPSVTMDDTRLAGDYHLLSQAGRWSLSHPSVTDPNKQVSGWLLDNVSSPCIDAGDPNADWLDELWPHGKRINMGAYGGTTQASLSSSVAGDIRDLNNDNMVTWNDVLQLTGKWDSNNAPLKEDLDRDGIVDINDLLLFEGNWQPDPNNSAPHFNFVSNQNVAVGSLLSFPVSAYDLNGDDLVYAAAGLPAGAVYDEQVFTWTPAKQGTYEVIFIAGDNKSLTYITIQITVE